MEYVNLCPNNIFRQDFADKFQGMCLIMLGTAHTYVPKKSKRDQTCLKFPKPGKARN